MSQVDLDLDVRVANYISDNVDLFDTLTLGNDYAPGMSLSYTLQPAGPATRYYDGRRRRSFAFAITAKHPHGIVCINTLSAIMDIMENATPVSIKSKNDSFKFISAKMTTSPEFLATVQDDDGQDAQKYGVYQGAFSVQVII
ncbi:hypothetical protein [Lactiplantibacillus pentosus]|uniref:hypothetical protein n=1 Tax=Lactiplantibacillus pentosus TaxID=1589 RepID=UPI0014038FDB|nr:hypothetical protein [Lactiplantibacillus pentosus]